MSSPATLLTRAQVAHIRQLLRDKRARNADGAFVIEGAKPVHDVLLNHSTHIRMLVTAPAYEQRESEPQRLARATLQVPAYRCPDRTFSTLSDLESPQGILAVVGQPRWNEEKILSRSCLFGLFGEQLQDPANVGAIIRTAAGLDVDALWLTPESADIYNPKVVRATSGALYSLPVFVTRDAGSFARKGCAIFAAQAGMSGTVQMQTIREVPKRMILALGNESRGLSSVTLKEAACRFSIPLSRQIESLNVAATAAIALYYFGRIAKTSSLA